MRLASDVVRLVVLWVAVTTCATLSAQNSDQRSVAAKPAATYSVEPITTGSHHHTFGYIGHVGTVPWNQSGHYVLALRFKSDDHMPGLNEPAEILLLDARQGYRPTKVAETRGWNLQQGAMMYWNPLHPDSQFFFNDRDAKTGEMFTVLCDISDVLAGKAGDPESTQIGTRVREYRFPGTSIANSGMAQQGGSFLALNYGRLTRLRLVTGIAGLDDWSQSQNAPKNDGVFQVDVETGERKLLISYHDLKMAIGDTPDIDAYGLFINHTLWSPDDDRFYFYLRANFRSELPKVDQPFTFVLDGKRLTKQPYVGGHPEWQDGKTLIGADGQNQIRYDVESQKIVGTIGTSTTFPDPGGDIALSPDQTWLINGHKRKELKQIFFTLFRESDSTTIKTDGFPTGDWLSGALRIDPAAAWNRNSDQVLFGAYDPTTKTRQLFVLTIKNP